MEKETQLRKPKMTKSVFKYWLENQIEIQTVICNQWYCYWKWECYVIVIDY